MKSTSHPHSSLSSVFALRSAIGLALAASLSLSACGDSSESGDSDAAASPPTSPQIEAAFVEVEPAGAISVNEARKKAEPGTELTVTGRIAGAMEPFSTDYATLILADDSLMTCERNPGDSCETPWDACCVDPKDIAAARLTIQVLGEDDRPVAGSLKSVRDLEELDTLVVTGTVAEGSNADNLILNATGIYPKPDTGKSGS